MDNFQFHFGNFVEMILAISFAMWAWLLRKFGEQHVNTIKDIVTELKEMRKEMMHFNERLGRLETLQEIQHSKE